jgi:hypothetical protein
MLCTTVGALRKKVTPEGWELFRKDSLKDGLGDPATWPEDEPVGVDKLGLLRYGAKSEYEAIVADVAELTGRA